MMAIIKQTLVVSTRQSQFCAYVLQYCATILVIEKQPESVNTTTGSDVKFTVITSLECRHVKVFVNSETAVDSTKVQEENITIPEQYIGWRLLITYTITTVNQSISGIEVLFRAYPDGTVVNSNAALLLVQGKNLTKEKSTENCYFSYRHSRTN